MSSSIRPHAALALAFLLSASPALSQGLGSRDRVPTAPIGGGYGPQAGSQPSPQPGPQVGAPGIPYGQPVHSGGVAAQAPADTYAGQWTGQASWPLPGGTMMTFPVSVDVERQGQGYHIRYSANIPAQSPEIQPSPTRWTGTFRGGVQQNPGSPQGMGAQGPYLSSQPQQGPSTWGQPAAPVPAFSFLMGESQDYRVEVVNTGQNQGPWYVSIGLMAENGRLVGQVGSPRIGFAQLQLNRAGMAQPIPGQLGQPGQQGQQGQQGNTLIGQWTGTASDTMDNGQPIQFPAQIQVTQDPRTGQVSATYSSTIPYPDEQSGRTVQLLVEETFTGTLQNGKARLSCPNVRILEAQSRQMLTSFPATLELTLDARGLTGSLGSEDMGWTKLQLQRSTMGAVNPGGMNPGAMNPGGWGQPTNQPGAWNPNGENTGSWQPVVPDQDVFGDEADTWFDDSTGGW